MADYYTIAEDPEAAGFDLWVPTGALEVALGSMPTPPKNAPHGGAPSYGYLLRLTRGSDGLRLTVASDYPGYAITLPVLARGTAVENAAAFVPGAGLKQWVADTSDEEIHASVGATGSLHLARTGSKVKLPPSPVPSNLGDLRDCIHGAETTGTLSARQFSRAMQVLACIESTGKSGCAKEPNAGGRYNTVDCRDGLLRLAGGDGAAVVARVPHTGNPTFRVCASVAVRIARFVRSTIYGRVHIDIIGQDRAVVFRGTGGAAMAVSIPAPGSTFKLPDNLGDSTWVEILTRDLVKATRPIHPKAKTWEITISRPELDGPLEVGFPSDVAGVWMARSGGTDGEALTFPSLKLPGHKLAKVLSKLPGDVLRLDVYRERPLVRISPVGGDDLAVYFRVRRVAE